MARTGFSISKTDRLKVQIGQMTSEERKEIGDFIRYTNIVESKRTSSPGPATRQTKKVNRKPRVVKRARKQTTGEGATSLVPSNVQSE